MTNDELNEKIRQACTHAAPDVLDAVLSDCNEQKGRVILMTTENKKKTMGSSNGRFGCRFVPDPWRWIGSQELSGQSYGRCYGFAGRKPERGD